MLLRQRRLGLVSHVRLRRRVAFGLLSLLPRGTPRFLLAAYEDLPEIARVLAEMKGNVSRTAELLGLERSNLYRKMKALGIAPKELNRLRKTLTHVVHCAASVSFDDSYENSFRANVQGARNALQFALSLQQAKGSRFIQHVAIETSYIHGRKKRSMAQENALVFPKNFYNNFYELTKAFASMETDQHMVADGLRVVQLLPAIVIGDSRTGNNRGDTKVVNAPVNAFGRAKEALDALRATPFGEPKAAAISRVAMVFPADRSAEINLVTVDRVVEGILAALTRPGAIFPGQLAMAGTRWPPSCKSPFSPRSGPLLPTHA